MALGVGHLVGPSTFGAVMGGRGICRGLNRLVADGLTHPKGP